MHEAEHREKHADWPRSGRSLALVLQQRFPSDDWLGALAKAAVRPRGDIECLLQQEDDVPDHVHDALAQIGDALDTGDAGARDDVFKASTNDADASMEVDREAGVIVQPADKPMPSRSGSAYEARSKEPKTSKNAEFLPFSGMPEAIAPLSKDEPGK
jgi:hypothetical protein